MTTVLDPAKEGFKKATPKQSTVLYKRVTETTQVNVPDGTETAHVGDYLIVVGDREQVTAALPKDRASGRAEIPETRVRIPVVQVLSKEDFESLYDTK